jgi:hypothetical protein
MGKQCDLTMIVAIGPAARTVVDLPGRRPSPLPPGRQNPGRLRMKLTYITVALALLTSGQAAAETYRRHDASWTDVVQGFIRDGATKTRHCVNRPPRCYDNLIGRSAETHRLVQLSELYDSSGRLESRLVYIYNDTDDRVVSRDWDTAEVVRLVKVNGVWEVEQP